MVFHPEDQRSSSTVLRRTRFLPGSRMASMAAVLSSTQLPDGPVTVTVTTLLLSRFVTRSRVPRGNWPLVAAGAPPSAKNVSAPEQTLPPTLNLHDPEEVAAQFDLVPLTPKPKALRHALSNSFGFGGVNASLVFSVHEA